MSYKATKIFCLCIAVLLSASALAQQKTPEQQEREMYEYIQKEVDQLTTTLDLNIAQTFWVDSILTYNLGALQKELNAMSQSKVGNTDLYYSVQDKWMEATYVAMERILDADQWSKYLKNGAARDKKARDKRAAKRK